MADIKRITVDQLKPGMFVHDLNCDWMSHPFAFNRFSVKGDEQINKIIQAGVKELYIDPTRGLDVSNAPTAQEVKKELESDLIRIVSEEPKKEIKLTLAQEMVNAKKIHKEAHTIVRNVMQDARLGKQVQIEKVEPLVEQMTESILRNQGALIALCGIKNKDDYTFLHSVSVCTLMVSFCRSLGLPDEQIRQGGIGGLLHDIGKMNTPLEILNKPGKYTDEEFAIMRRHPEEGHQILLQTPGVGEVPLTICIQHHERMDGTGYPNNLKADQIDMMGKISAVVDVYDAISSNRCYHKGMEPTDALRKMLEWSRFHFDPNLVQAFIRCLGIYPVGSMVMLESGRLAVVVEQNPSNMLMPTVKAFYDTRKLAYIEPVVRIDLAKTGADRVVSHESSEKWAVDPMDYI